MKHLFIIVSFLLISFGASAQAKFQSGYFIKTDGTKITCLIKNIGWRNNPTKIEYKLSETDKVQEVSISSMQEFGIDHELKFQRFTVKIDRSSESLEKLSSNRHPEFNEEQLLLNVLLEGKASLYSYLDGTLTRFFSKTDNSPIEQLVFKSYLTKKNEVRKNYGFRQQLLTNINCGTIGMDEINKIDYQKNSLIRYFINYNQCEGASFTNIAAKHKKPKINFRIRPGINKASLSINNQYSIYKNVDFDDQINFRLGFESEVVFPFNKNKWAFIFEPTFQYYQSSVEVTYPYTPDQTLKLDYSSLELPIGIRHYVHLGEKSKLYVNPIFIFDLRLSNKLTFVQSSLSEQKEVAEGALTANMGIGAGYAFGDRLNLELRLHTKRDFLTQYRFWHSDYKTISVIFGYRLFGNK